MARKVGRPTKFTKSVAVNLCSQIAAGISLRSICRDDPKMPCIRSVFNWLHSLPEFMHQYEEAKVQSADALAEDILAIADEDVFGPLLVAGEVQFDKKGDVIMVRDTVGVAHARLRVDTRKWAASKLKPKKYGDYSRSDNHVIVDFGKMSDTELDDIIDGERNAAA